MNFICNEKIFYWNIFFAANKIIILIFLNAVRHYRSVENKSQYQDAFQ